MNHAYTSWICIVHMYMYTQYLIHLDSGLEVYLYTTWYLAVCTMQLNADAASVNQVSDFFA